VIGWALKENQIYGKKGGGKQIGDKVKEYLQIYFLSGNMDRSQRFSAKDMLEELEERVKLGELASEELPTIKTIEGWISRFAASHKKSMAQKILEENQNKNQ
jgi:hypothetical protein